MGDDMALYAGETVRISTTALNLDQETPLTDLDVTDAQIEIYDREANLLVDTDLVWSTANQEWYYDWTTTGQEPGSYRAKLILTGVAFYTFEIKRFNLRRSPV